jgi:hypothetical protein
VSLYENLRKAYVAFQVLRGRRDDPIAELEQSLRTEDALRKVLERTQDERQYWYDLWFQHSREYHNAQSQLLSEINELRRKLGMPDADKLGELEKRAEDQRHARLVEPRKHPVPGVKSPLKKIEPPPAKPVSRKNPLIVENKKPPPKTNPLMVADEKRQPPREKKKAPPRKKVTKKAPAKKSAKKATRARKGSQT